MSALIKTGYGARIRCDITADKAAFNIPSSTVVKATLISLDGDRVLIPSVTCSDASSGADWATSKVMVEFNEAETAAVAEMGGANIELQVDGTADTPWTLPVLVQKGHPS